MHNLTRSEINKFDKQGMLDRIVNFPDQLEHALSLASNSSVALKNTDINNICVTGMGGSAIGGDIVRGLLNNRLEIPFVVNRFYALPKYIDRNSLVIACSYSGNTEETLSAYENAHKRGAHIVCISSGGTLTDKAKRHGYPIFSVPTGYPPRSALGYLTVPILFTLYQTGLLDQSPQFDLKETIEVLRKYSTELHPDREDNAAKKISLSLMSKIPLIYACVQGFEPVVMRWKGQFCENSKVLAFNNVFPELNHNEIMGWGPLAEINQLFQVIFLRDRDDHKQVERRMEITKSIVEQHTGETIEVFSKGESLLARIFSLIYLGDMVSLYLGILNRVDPTSIGNIDFLKQKLAAT